MRLTSDPPARPENCKSICEVWDGAKWVSQPSVTIMTAKQRREEDRKFGAERKAQAVPVDIRGAYGPSASSINGIYEPTNEICGGWPVYRKQGDPDKWLEYIVATNEWYVKPTADRGRAEGWMCLASDPPTKPEFCRLILLPFYINISISIIIIIVILGGHVKCGMEINGPYKQQ